MMIDQADLLDGMDWLFVQKYMALAVMKNYAKGDFIVREGDKADNFFTLIEGSVRLSVGGGEKDVYVITHPGEAFGWSSLLERNYYSASAECLEPTRLHKIERNKLNQLLQAYPEASAVFYKRIAGMLGHRLVESYKLL
jgi:CRP-like cAMP-binding protein